MKYTTILLTVPKKEVTVSALNNPAMT